MTPKQLPARHRGGASEIWVKDAHDSGRNLLAERLPVAARLIRGWSGHPFMMLQELDSSFAALALVGYHAGAGSAGSPLAHTLTGQVTRLTLNGRLASEFLLAAYTAALVKVPLILVSGDAALCHEVTGFHPPITTIAVKRRGWRSDHQLATPEVAAADSRYGASLRDPSACLIPLPEHFNVECPIPEPALRLPVWLLPGAQQTDPHTVCFEHEDYLPMFCCSRLIGCGLSAGPPSRSASPRPPKVLSYQAGAALQQVSGSHLEHVYEQVLFSHHDHNNTIVVVIP
jgi:D-amino peptidase